MFKLNNKRFKDSVFCFLLIDCSKFYRYNYCDNSKLQDRGNKLTMKDKKGFTLIELIAVILILGIITLIGIPTISKIIKEAQKNAFKDSASNIIKAATFTNSYKEKGQSTIYNTKTDLDYTGKKYDGFVYIKSDDNVQINILDDKHNWCMYKGYGDTDLSLKENITSLEDCMLENGTSDKTYTLGENAVTPISGTFIQPWLYKTWSDEQWATEIAYWKEIGIQYLIMGDVAERQADGRWITYYNSSLPFANQQYYEALNKLFQNLEGSGIKLFIGMGMDSQWWNLDLTKDEDQAHFYTYCQESMQITEELYNMYYEQYSDIFYGFYFTPELSNSSAFSNTTTRTKYVVGLANGLNVVFDKINQLNKNIPMLFSPYINYFGGDWVTKNPDDIEKFYTELFNTANFRNGDILMPQDSVGAGGMNLVNLSRFTRAYKKATINTTKKILLWSNTEAFIQPTAEVQNLNDGVNYWGTASLNRVFAQMNIEKFYADKIFLFAYPHYISPTNAVSGFRDTLNNYLTTGKLESVKPTPPTTVKTSIRNVDGTNVLSVSWDDANDNYGIARINIYKNDEFLTYRVASRADATSNIPSFPNNFYDSNFNLTEDVAVYQLEFIDCAGNKSDKVEFIVNKGQTSNIIEVQKGTINRYKEYKVGDSVTLKDGSKWHVIEKSSITDTSVVLLRDDSLGIMAFDKNGYRSSDTSTYCNAASYGGCNAWKQVEGNYINNTMSGTVIKNSSLYDYLNTAYKQTLLQSGVSGIIGDIQLITKDKYLSLFDSNYAWLSNNTYWWTMTPSSSNTVDIYAVGSSNDVYTTLVNNEQSFNVRPVITINKSTLE